MVKNYIIPHYPFYSEPKVVNEAQHFVQDVRQLLEQIDAEYAIPDELKDLRNDADAMSKVAEYVASKQYNIPMRQDFTLTDNELKAADYYLKAGDKGARVSKICNELFSKMVGFTIDLDTYAKNYVGDQIISEYIVNLMDLANGKYGNENELCLFCHSKETGGNGIIHTSRCPIFFYRNKGGVK
jgi:hypothetical protein